MRKEEMKEYKEGNDIFMLKPYFLSIIASCFYHNFFRKLQNLYNSYGFKNYSNLYKMTILSVQSPVYFSL